MQRLIQLVLLIALCPSIAFAKPLTTEQVPEPLKPWINWVLEDHPERNCPFIYNSYEQKRCSWPSETQLDLTPKKGRFTSRWLVYTDSWVSLPGDSKHWPQGVSINNQPALVMDRDGVPSVKLAANSKQPAIYQIDGEFLWDAIPDNLGLPVDTGLINVTINNVAIPAPTIKEGLLWLKAGETGQNKPEQVENSIDIQVFRKISDSVPVEVLTRLIIEVSGTQREIKLPGPLLDNFLPLSLSSPLPARLEPDGQLLVQIRPGLWQIDVLARNTGELTQLSLPTTATATEISWPQTEIWAFEAHPELRVVEIQQVGAIDASQTNLPDDWKNLPAYSINAGQTMAFKVIRRGDPEPEPNQLNLVRKLWLDFDGAAYTANDSITGTMKRGWRLNALPSTQIGKVTLDGSNQLITLQPDTAKQGVEVRKGQLNLDADSRIVGVIGTISAVGWEQGFRTVRAELNLPPGWRLLAAAGVDNVPDSWLSRWTLLDLFLVLIAALATARIWHNYWGLFTLVTLVIIWHEAGAPHFVWLNILAATALLKVLPHSKLFDWLTYYRQLCWLALVLIAIPFMVDQVRMGLYPQLEIPQQGIDGPNYPMSEPLQSVDMQEQSADQAVMESGSPRNYTMPSTAKALSYYPEKRAKLERIDPDAKVQTGPGLPQWHWHKILLSWNGSVDAQQQLTLWYLSPTMTMLLNFLRVIFTSILALLMFGVAEKLTLSTFKFKSTASLLFWLFLLPILATPSRNAYADFPDQALLAELKNRLQEITVPDCLPACAQIQQMKLVITDKTVAINLDIHAQEPVTLPLPADFSQWFPNQVLDNGAPAAALFRDNNGLWISLKAGTHQVTLSGVTPLLNKFAVPLPLKPKYVSVANSGWDVIGLQENGWADDQLQFSRSNQSPQQQAKPGLEPGILPAFVRVERRLSIALDWRVNTRIIRVSPADSAVALKVPLLPGEAVTSAGIRVKDGYVEANLSAQQTLLEWQSTLEKSAKITLTAPPTEQWVEVWQADVSPIWHVEASGIAMIRLDDSAQWLPEWHPWPGETVELKIARPEAVAGQTLTIDNSTLSLKPGQRSRDATLGFNLRSSQGMQYALTLPEQAVLQSVTIDGQSQPIHQQGRKLILPVNPGTQAITVSWQESTPLSILTTTPEVDLGLASVNSHLNIGLGQDRWVLFAFGPKLGPAVLFWGILIVLFILSIGLGKISLTPLKHWQWFLLLVGLSQIPISLASIVIGWLMLLGWRSKQTMVIRHFNGLQIALAGLTLLALGILFFAVAQGLLSTPDMSITGNQSSAFNLNWYQDRSPSTLPLATLVSVPLIVYRLLMLAWSLWLAVSLLDWLKWGWRCYASNGLWQKKPISQQSVEAERKQE